MVQTVVVSLHNRMVERERVRNVTAPHTKPY